jgi:hypothetical protein
VTSKNVQFSPRLAAVAAAPDRPSASSAPAAVKVTRGNLLLRLVAVALIVGGIGVGLHMATAEKREQERRAQIQNAIDASGVTSGVVGTGVSTGDASEPVVQGEGR